MDILSLIKSRVSETYDLHRKFVNHQLVRVLEVIGYDRNYVKGKGSVLVDHEGREVLDFLSGFGACGIGRSHPTVVAALHAMLDSEPPTMVQMDVGCVAGLLAEALCAIAPGKLDAVFFTTSGTEGVEGALKFARQATRRHKIVHCERAFHGLTLGSLSVNGNEEFRARNEPLLAGCVQVPFGDLAALEEALAGNDVAGFILEPIQGKGVFLPPDDYLPGARKLCDRHGTLLIADEVQTGLGRTGRMFAIEHWNTAPDILVLSKALSGGFVPVGAILTRREIYAKVFDSMDRCFAHSNTFGRGDLAMAAGLATLHVIAQEKLVQNSAAIGEYLLSGLRDMAKRYELLAEVRGKGLMIGIQFGEPKSLGLKTGWKLLHAMNPDLFCQMITMPLLADHDILTQVAGHGLDTVKLLPPLTIGRAEADRFLAAMDDVLKAAHRFPGSTWKTIKDLGLRTAKTA